jgi:predicted Zn-dependent protease
LIPSDGEPIVYLVSIGGVPEAILEYVAEYVHSKHGLDVRLLPPSPPHESAFDAERDQYITEVLLDGLQQQYPKSEPGDGSVVIGVLTDDVYILDRTDWAWAFGMRGDGGYAVVSTARMGSLDEPIDPIVLSRLRKMVLRNIGVLYFGLPLNDDPLSVLYRDVLGVDDLDRMGEEFCGTRCPSRASVGERTAVRVRGSAWPVFMTDGSRPGA